MMEPEHPFPSFSLLADTSPGREPLTNNTLLSDSFSLQRNRHHEYHLDLEKTSGQDEESYAQIVAFLPAQQKGFTHHLNE